MNRAQIALVIIDVQDGLDDPQYGKRNNPDAELRIADLLAAWRRKKFPVIFGRYNSRRRASPLKRGSRGNQIEALVAPRKNEFVVEKSVNSIFKARGFISHLKALGAHELVFVGIATDACISASVREARDLGYSVWIAADGCATFDRRTVGGDILRADLVHDIELGILYSAGVHVSLTAQILRRIDQKPPNKVLELTTASGAAHL